VKRHAGEHTTQVRVADDERAFWEMHEFAYPICQFNDHQFVPGTIARFHDQDSDISILFVGSDCFVPFSCTCHCLTMPFIARYECNLLTRVKRFLLLAPAQSPRYTRVDCLPWALRALFTLGPVCDWYPPHVRWPHYKGKVYDRKAFLGGVCVVGMVVPMHIVVADERGAATLWR